MLESVNSKSLQYQKLSKEEMQSRGILGRLVGICADFIAPTRNGRKYSEELWEKVFDNPIMKEKIANKVCYGELGHPSYEEIDMSKACVQLAEQPKKGPDGKLRAVFDILNTPNGQILNTLCQYGSTLGVSSRGQGDLITDYEGNEEVDPETYTCECFDIVAIPAVKEARLQYVTESLDTKKPLRQALTESINNASIADQKIMRESLNTFGFKLNEKLAEHAYAINYYDINDKLLFRDFSLDLDEILKSTEDLVDTYNNEFPADVAYIEVVDENNNILKYAQPVDDVWELKESYKKSDEQSDSHINAKNEKDSANNNGENLVETLQQTLNDNVELHNKVVALQEKLSVCYAKELDTKEEIDNYKKKIGQLSESVKSIQPLKDRINVLSEQLKQQKTTIDDSVSLNEDFKNRLSESRNQSKKLKEDLENRNNHISELNEKLQNLIATNQKQVSTLENKLQSLNEDFQDLKKDSLIKTKEYQQKIEESTSLVEKYRKIAKTAIDKYIKSQADMLGLSVNDIKCRLTENYSFSDIDKVCEDLKMYKLNIDNLPFSTSRNTKIKMTESVDPVVKSVNNLDDSVDNSLYELAGL